MLLPLFGTASPQSVARSSQALSLVLYQCATNNNKNKKEENTRKILASGKSVHISSIVLPKVTQLLFYPVFFLLLGLHSGSTCGSGTSNSNYNYNYNNSPYITSPQSQLNWNRWAAITNMLTNVDTYFGTVMLFSFCCSSSWGYHLTSIPKKMSLSPQGRFCHNFIFYSKPITWVRVGPVESLKHHQNRKLLRPTVRID